MSTDADIFISFPGKDRKVATTLCSALESRGFKCWISARDILPGENFQIAIVQAIRKAKVMLLVFTANSNQSEEMSKELALASQQKMPVIPLRVEDVTPNDAFAYEFATRQWIDFFADWEYAIDQLAAQIGKITRPAEPVAVATAAPAPAAKAKAKAAPPRPAPELPAVELAPIIDTSGDAPAYQEPDAEEETGEAEPRKGPGALVLVGGAVAAVVVIGGVVFAMTAGKGKAPAAKPPVTASAPAKPESGPVAPPVPAAPTPAQATAVDSNAPIPPGAVALDPNAPPSAAAPSAVRTARKAPPRKAHTPLRATRSDVPY